MALPERKVQCLNYEVVGKEILSPKRRFFKLRRDISPNSYCGAWCTLQTLPPGLTCDPSDGSIRGERWHLGEVTELWDTEKFSTYCCLD